MYKYKLFFYFQRLIKGHSKRDFLSKLLSFFLPKSSATFTADEKHALDILSNIGFFKLPQILSFEQIEEINKYLKNKKIFERYDKEKKYFTLENIPYYAHTGSYDESVLIKCPHIVSSANNPLVIKLVEGFLGAKPTLSNITLWHSFAKDGKPRNAEFYHRDVDDLKFVKVFIYLTDVGFENGPHVYIDESSKLNEFLNIKRYTDDEIEGFFSPEKIRKITGCIGDAFIEDTYGLHKGMPVEKGVRTVLQFEYSLLPIGSKKYNLKFDSNDLDVNSYINRMYL